MKKTYDIEVDCPNCANLCEAAAAKVAGIASVTINYMTQKMTIEFSEEASDKKVIKEILKVCRKIEPDFDIDL